MNTNEEEAPGITAILAQPEVSQPNLTQPDEEVTPFKCPKCPKRFRTQSGVTMHNLRVHTNKLGDGFKWKGGAVRRKTREEKLAARRIYNRKWRAKRGMAVSPELFKENKGGNKGMKLSSWSPERRAKFTATMKRKAASKRRAEIMASPPMKPKRIQFAYPLSEATEKPPVTTAAIRHCPYCGENIERHLL